MFNTPLLANSMKAKVIFLVSILLAIFLCFLMPYLLISNKTDLMVEGYKASDALIYSFVTKQQDSSLQFNTLKSTFQIINDHKLKLYDVMNTYYTLDTAFTLNFTYSSIIFGLLSFLTLKRGWDNVNNFYLKASFLIFFFLSSFFGLIIKVLNTEEIYVSNRIKIDNFSKMQIDILNLCQDTKGFKKANQPDSINFYTLQIINDVKANQDIFMKKRMEAMPTNVTVTQ
jgi:hypothetical protein